MALESYVEAANVIFLPTNVAYLGLLIHKFRNIYLIFFVAGLP